MSKLTVHEITTKNFLRYGNNTTTFNVGLDKLVLIMGKNGCGKSTLPIDVLFFNWYGKSFRKKTTLPKLVNNKTKKELETSTTVTTPEGIKYKIIRNRKPELFEVYKEVNGQFDLIKPPSDLKQYQKWLEENVLRMSDETFRQVVVLGSSSYQPFMELDTPKRRQVVEDLLSLRVYSYMNKIAKERVKNMKVEVNELQTKYLNSEHLLKANQDTLVEIQTRSSNFIEENQQQIDTISQENNKLFSEVESVNNVIADLQSKIQDKDDKKVEFSETNNKITLCNNKLSEIQSKHSFYTHNETCPECKQDLEKSFVENTLGELDNKKQLVESKVSEIQEKQDNIKARLMEIKAIIDEIGLKNQEVNSLNQKIMINNSQIQSLQNNINSFQTQDTSQVQAKIDAASKDVKKNKKLFEEKESDLAHHNALLGLLKDDAIKADVIRDYIPIINKTISDYLQVIGFNATFKLDESFKETIIIEGEELSYDTLSQGQKLRLNLVLMFTWREISRLKSSAACSLLVLDEVCDSSLDAEGVDAMFALMRHVSKEGNQNTVVISHSETTQSNFKVAYEVSLDQGFSSIKKLDSF